MIQFTVSEVRANATYRRKSEPVLAAMLDTFADLLEAQESATPAAEMTEGGLTWYQQFSPQRNAGTKFYTHPAPVDEKPPVEAAFVVPETCCSLCRRNAVC